MTSWIGRTAALAALGLALAPSGAAAQLPPAAELVPAGFKVEVDQNLGGSRIIKATKPNENYPKPHMDYGIELNIMAMPMPMGVEQMLEMALAGPEEPAARTPGSATRTEPCGKERYQGGVLICQKSITPWIGSGKAPDVMTWDVSWQGKGPNGLVTAGITRFYGSREAAVGVLDAIIPRLKAGK